MEKVRYMISDGRRGITCVTLLGRRTRSDDPAQRDGSSILYTRKHTGVSKDKTIEGTGVSVESNPVYFT